MNWPTLLRGVPRKFIVINSVDIITIVARENPYNLTIHHENILRFYADVFRLKIKVGWLGFMV